VVAVINPVGGPLTITASLADTNNTLRAKQFQEQLNAALPGWVQPVHLGFAALTAVLVIALFVALARSRTPASDTS
jgi:heme A synthase